MRSLQVVGVENDALIVVTDSGERFTIAIDSELLDLIRKRPHTGPTSPKRVPPRDIQAHIRRGLSAQQVADLTGETLDYVQLFEGPVVAERDFIVEQARSILFHQAGQERDRQSSFGEAVAQRLSELGARDEAWTAWREDSGWKVEVRFVDGEVEHRAVWSFEPRKQTLSPDNEDAAVLSQDEPIHGPLIPRLRPVVATDEQPAGERFDSEIFQDMPLNDTGPLTEPVAYGRLGQDIEESSPTQASAETADLLEALRRRRGEREPAPSAESESVRSRHPSTGSIRLVSADDDTDDDEDGQDASIHPFPGTGEVPQSESAEDESEQPRTPPSRKGRPEMPSWDDIVFGTRPDSDDPA